MLQNKFVYLLITFIWLTGGFGVLLSLLYMGQYRRRNWWSIGNTVSVPRTMTPLYGSLLLFCSGLALQSLIQGFSQATWLAIGWTILAMLFAVQGASVVIQALDNGWDTPLVAEPEGNGLSSGVISTIATVFLITNGGLIGWWAVVQYEAGALDTAFFWRDERVPVATTTPTLQPFGSSEQIAQTRSNAIQQEINTKADAQMMPTMLATESVVAQPTTSAEQLGNLANLPPAVVTVAAPMIQITPTPLVLSARSALAVADNDKRGGTDPATTVRSTVVVSEPVALREAFVVSATFPLSATDTLTDTTAFTSTVAEVSNSFVPLPLTVRSTLGANLRRAPSTRAAIIETLANNRTAEALGRSADGEWLQLRLVDGTTGWLFAQLTSLAGSIDALPVIE